MKNMCFGDDIMNLIKSLKKLPYVGPFIKNVSNIHKIELDKAKHSNNII